MKNNSTNKLMCHQEQWPCKSHDLFMGSPDLRSGHMTMWNTSSARAGCVERASCVSCLHASQDCCSMVSQPRTSLFPKELQISSVMRTNLTGRVGYWVTRKLWSIGYLKMKLFKSNQSHIQYFALSISSY